MVYPIYFSPAMLLLISILIIWSAIWKALALWRSARLNQPVWFVLLFLINILGLLEIIYLFFVAKAPQRPIQKPAQKELQIKSPKVSNRRISKKRR